MGLDISVGGFARAAREEPDDLEVVREGFEHLNSVLRANDIPIHHEPEDLPPEAFFSAQMWGYSGLHTVRRLAAHLTLTGALPPPGNPGDAADDPMIGRLTGDICRHLDGKGGGFLGLFGRKAPAFMHLLAHSDAEGFYIPRDVEKVIIDRAPEQMPSVGGMVGSAPRLLAECRTLARALDVPLDLDPEADEVWENAESPPSSGAAWRRYGVETFCLTRLLKACDLSVKFGAAVEFC